MANVAYRVVVTATLEDSERLPLNVELETDDFAVAAQRWAYLPSGYTFQHSTENGWASVPLAGRGGGIYPVYVGQDPKLCELYPATTELGRPYYTEGGVVCATVDAKVDR